MYKRRNVVFAALSVGLVLATLLGTLPATAQGEVWNPGPGAVLDSTYDGLIDAPTANAQVSSGGFTVAGWFVDKTAEGWAGVDDVQVWLGSMDGGGTMLASAQFGQSRPDVGVRGQFPAHRRD